MVDKNVKLTISAGVGIIVLAAFTVHAAVFGLVFEALHSNYRTTKVINLPEVSLPSGGISSSEQGNLHAVNIAEREGIKQGFSVSAPAGAINQLTEIKTQYAVPCDGCQPQYQPVPQQVQYQPYQPVERRPLLPLRPLQPRPSPTPVQPPQPVTPVQPVQPSPLVSPSQKTEGRYQIAVFSNNSPQSAAVVDWFSSHAGLAQLRQKCAYQVYTLDSPIYKARFANIVPPQWFPAVAFLRPDGGHVHVAYSGNNLPTTADALYSDMHQGFQLMQSVKNAAESSLVESQDCNGPNCPLPAIEEDRKPQFPILRPFNKEPDEKNGFVRDLLWGGVETIALIVAIVVLGILAFVLLVAIVIKALRGN